MLKCPQCSNSIKFIDVMKSNTYNPIKCNNCKLRFVLDFRSFIYPGISLLSLSFLSLILKILSVNNWRQVILLVDFCIIFLILYKAIIFLRNPKFEKIEQEFQGEN